VAATFFANGAIIGTWVSRIPAIKRALTLSDGELGLALLAVAAGALVAMPLCGRAVARRGSRGPTSACLLALCGCLVAVPAAPSLVLLALVLIAFGAANGAVDVAMNSHGIAVERRYGRPILSSFPAAFSAGGLAGSAVGGLVASAGIGPQPHFAVAAALFAALALAIRPRLLPAEEDAGGDAAPAFAIPTRPLALLGAIAFCCFFAEGSAADWSAVYVSGPLGAGDGVAALAFAGFSVAMTAGRSVGDRLAERVDAPTLARGGALLAAGGIVAALTVGTTPVAILGFTCLGAGVANVFPLVLRSAGGALAIAAVSTTGYMGFLLGPPVIGGAAELVGLRAALGIVAGLVVLLAALAPALARREP
jgi:MFS family permease